MNEELQIVYLARHGETAWSLSGLESSVNSRYFMLSTASLSALSYEHEISRPVIRLWNETRHVELSPQ